MGADYGFTETLEDGTEITMLEEGEISPFTTSSNVTSVNANPACKQSQTGGFLQRNPDGVVIRQFKDGSLLQTNVDGSSISTSSSGKMVHRLADGTEILHMEGGGEKVRFGPSLSLGLADQTWLNPPPLASKSKSFSFK